MSTSEDSEVDQKRASFTSYQPVQTRNHAPTSSHSPDSRQSDHSELLTNTKNDWDSDDSFLPTSDDLHDSHVGQSDDIETPVDPLVAEDSYYTRPNRYYGPASTWRSWTKEDRDVAESLELDRAQDLSVHLYNAHVIRSQTLKSKESSSRKRSSGTSETADDDHIFKVPKLWTAWPMPPDEVPRNLLYPAALDTRPSKELEECLMGATMKAARERWNAREWEEDDKPAGDSPDHGQAPVMQTSGSGPLVEGEGSHSTSDDTSTDDGYRIDPTAKPVPLADDDKARSLLLPSTRHVISSFDHLLLALHRARQSYALPILTDDDDDDRAASSATDAERQSSVSSGKRRRHSGAQRASSASKADTGASARTSSSRRRKGVWKEGSVPRNRKYDALGMRDWSDVLGMAALMGWNEEALARASKRCAGLFGEDMLFRTFYEAEHAGEKSFFTERFASGGEPSESQQATYSQILQAQETTDLRYPCPVETCLRHKTPFRTPGNLKQHMEHRHAQFKAENGEERIAEVAMYSGRPAFCPVQTCERSYEPFADGSRLYRHIRKWHPEVNVENLKKLESQRRGENRGKWTGEKRKRNPYQRV